MSHDNHNHGNHQKHEAHHIIPPSVYMKVFGALLVLTVITVAVAQVDLGRLNMIVAIGVASIKAALVCMFFMGLWWDKKENAVIFVTSFVFLMIFIVLTATDLFFRGDVYVHGPLVAPKSAKAKFKKPWIATNEIKAHGKELFVAQCTSCHGDVGRGDGPAAGALDPKPRNFTVDAGWINGRKPSQIYKTLTDGLNKMPAFTSLPGEDRWALAHYVISLGSSVTTDNDADLKKAGIDPSKDDAGGSAEKTVPIEFAIDRVSQ